MTFLTRSALPGFHLTLGYTLVYLSVIVLLPLAGVFYKTAELGLSAIIQILLSERVISALSLSFGTALIAALFNAIFGTLLAWVFVRYTFPGKRLFDAVIDLPFALPTAVAGIALTALYSPNGWVGQWLQFIGVNVAFTPAGIVIALLFISLPFVVRTVEPVLRDLDKDVEEAAASLGANRWQTIRLVVIPAILPALLTGFALAFARGIGEYGSVIFIAGNLPYLSEIAPLLIVIRLEEFDYAGATTVAAAMLVIAFCMLFIINGLQAWSNRHKKRHQTLVQPVLQGSAR